MIQDQDGAAPASARDTLAEGQGGVLTTAPSTAGDLEDRGRIVENDIGDSEEELIAAIDATIKPFDEGDIVAGTIVKIDKDEVLLDIGYKSEGVIPSRELSIRNDVDPSQVVSVGDEIEALVLQKEDAEGRLILSKKRAQYERAWGQIEEIKRRDGTVKGPVIEVVKGGLILDIGLRGFLPASLVEMRRVRDLHPYVGKELECRIIELDKNRNNVVLSRRKFLEESQAEQRHEFLNSLDKGEVRKGVVSSIVNFGAFVDLGGVDGLVHVSELSWKHVDHPSEVVDVNQEVEVEVLDVDLERERVSLSLKATQEDPWRQFARRHEVGDVIEGRVSKIVPFGVFLEVDDSIEGLVHISELAPQHVEKAEDVVRVHERIPVKIIDIDLHRRRISLSRKQALAGEELAGQRGRGEEERGGIELEREAEMQVEGPRAEVAGSAPAVGSEAETAEGELVAHPGGGAATESVPESARESTQPPLAEEEPGIAAAGVQVPETTPEAADGGAEAGESRAAEPGDESLESIVQDLKRKHGHS